MTNFDPTTNRIPTGLLTLDEKSALMAWPHGWERVKSLPGAFEHCDTPMWYENTVYRGKPAPVVKQLFAAVYPNDVGRGYESLQDVLSTDRRIGFICVDIVDGKLKDARVVEGDET